MALDKQLRNYLPPSPPPSSPPLLPQARAADIHSRKYKHLQTPVSAQQDYKSPLLQKIIPGISYLSPLYSYLTTPAPTPPPSSHGPGDNTNFTSSSAEESFAGAEDDMAKTETFRFSASAGRRSFATRRAALDSPASVLTSEDSFRIFDDDYSHIQPSSAPTTPPSSTTAKLYRPRVDFRNNVNTTKNRFVLANPQRKKKNTKKVIPPCYEHSLRTPGSPPSCDVVPCDWVRPRNSNRFNDYTNADVQCGIPKCETCIADETYGPLSIWALSAPAGHSAESHRLRSRVRYLCNRCEQPAPLPPDGGFGPVEMCTCVLRDHAGIPTDIWFQCSDCAESNWFDHDARFRNPEGVPAVRKARKRKNKYGIVVRPRAKGPWHMKRCCCGRLVPKDARYGVWCTWCNCPVEGQAGIELGGAATKSGPSFVVKKDEDDSEDEAVGQDNEGEDETMLDIREDGEDADVTEGMMYKDITLLDDDTVMGELEEDDSGIEV